MDLYLFILFVMLGLALILALAALTFLLYQQMLAHNEVNKRMLTITSEAMLSVKITQEEVETFIRSLDQPVKESILDESKDENTTVFNPHGYQEE